MLNAPLLYQKVGSIMLDMTKVADCFKVSNEKYTTEPKAEIRKEDGLVEVTVRINVVGEERQLGFRWLADLTGLTDKRAYVYFKEVGSSIMVDAIDLQLQ